MLPNLTLSPGLMLRFLTQLQQGQANGAPIEALYVGTHVLSDRGQVLEVTEEMVDEIVRNFAALDGPERIPISVNHNTGAGTLEEARAVGWIIRMFKQTNDEGRISLMMEPRWLDDAREAIEQEHFRFVSVGMMLRDKHPTSGEEIGAHVLELSITNVPAIAGLMPITLTAMNAPSKIALSTQVVLDRATMTLMAGMAGSLMDRVDCVIRAFYGQYPDSNQQMWIVRDVATDQVIVSRRNGEGEKTWQVGYTMDPDGGCTFQPMPQWVEVRQVYVPVTTAANKKQRAITLAAMKPTPNCEMAPEDMAWDSSAAMGRVKKWATKEDGAMDMAKYRQAFAWNDGSENATGCKLPHHDMVDGQLKVVKAGVIAAGNAMMGGRGGVQMPEEDMPGVKTHMAAHYKQFEMEPPWEQQEAARRINSANPKQQQQLKAAGTEPAASTHKEQKKMDENQIRSLLGLAADADLATVLPALAAKAGEVEALKAKIADLEKVQASAAATQEKLAATEGQVLTLTQQKQAFEQETTTLATRLKALEEERGERDATDRRAKALKDRKVTPAELEAEDKFLWNLAKEQPATFDKIMAARPAYPVSLTVELGSGAEGAPEETPADKLFRLVDAELAKDPDLKPQDARKLVLAAHPELKGAIKTAAAG